FDALTELPNATMFRAALSGLVAAHRRFALVLVGLESMRAINAERGPRVGDTVLRTVSHRLRLLFPDNAILSRLAGAEFGIALQGDTEPDRLTALCRELFDSLAVPMVVDGVQLEVGCCAGVALHPHDGLTVED